VRAHGRLTGQPAYNVFRDQILRPITRPLVDLVAPLRGASPHTPVWEATVSAIHPDFARAMHAEERLRAARKDRAALARASDLELRMTTLAAPADFADTSSGFRAWFGIETRDPTADRRVVEYCFAIPSAQYLHHGMSRALVRRAMEGYLPDQVRLRRTRGDQGADWIEWLPAMRPDLAAELDRLDRSETARQCLDLARMRRLMEQWPDPLGIEHDNDYRLLLLRGIMMGRFIRWFEETYA
jgi:asparagine synthase (glutamine-hydrolysing)